MTILIIINYEYIYIYVFEYYRDTCNQRLYTLYHSTVAMSYKHSAFKVGRDSVN